MSAAGRYGHLLSVVEERICAEAWKVSQYENIDTETASEAKARWDDWELLRDAIANGLMERLAAESGKHLMSAGAASSDVGFLMAAIADGGVSAGQHAAHEVAREMTRRALAGSAVTL